MGIHISGAIHVKLATWLIDPHPHQLCVPERAAAYPLKLFIYLSTGKTAPLRSFSR
jgi:hypothetical protein